MSIGFLRTVQRSSSESHLKLSTKELLEGIEELRDVVMIASLPAKRASF